MKADLYKQLVWDYELSQDNFEKILSGKHSLGQLDQSWAISRVLENLNYYDAMSLVSLDTLKKSWPAVEGKLFKQSIKKGYEFLLRRQTLSAAR